MLDVVEPWVTAFAAHSDTVRFLADITSDGTSNGSIMSIVRKVIAGCAVILAGGFAVLVLRTGMAKEEGGPGGGGKTKKLTDEAKNFAYAEGLIAVVWVIAEIAAQVFGGAGS